MKKATTVKEAYQAFAYEKKLTKNDMELYIDLYGEEFEEFVITLENNQDKRKTFTMVGQGGNGKSTALNLLSTRYPKLENIYDFKYITNEVIPLYGAIDIVDVSLMIGSAITKDNEKLNKKYIEGLKNIDNSRDSKISGDKFLSVLDGSINIEALYNMDKEARSIAKYFLKTRIQELINLINKTILAYQVEANNDKKLLIIIDDLEKKDILYKYFIKDMLLLDEINIVKILTLPIYSRDILNTSNIKSLELKNIDEKENVRDKDILRKVILKRIDESLITKQAIEMSIEYSGANLRQLMMIIHISAEKSLGADGVIIGIQDVEKAIEKLKKNYSLEVTNLLTLLNYISEYKIPQNSEKSEKDLISAIKTGAIFARFSDIIWFELNPICKELLSIYNENYSDSIKIENYFSIKNIELSNLKNKKEVYFIGENGGGKTILLQAILLAYKGKSHYSALSRDYNESTKNAFTIELRDNNISSIFAYGINRNKIDEDNSDKEGGSGIFDTPYIKGITFLNRPQKLFIHSSIISREFREKIIDLLDNKIQIEINNNEVDFYETGHKIEFGMLSEGYKSTIIWTSDLVLRLIENEPMVKKLEDFKNTIVLIDEIDLYLHPRWKYSFVYKLRSIFPNIRFIMTTHSTATILGASKDAIFYNVYKDENGYTQIKEPISDISDYSANILSTSPLFNMKSAKSRAYDDKKNNLSSDDYNQHELNKKVEKYLSEYNNEESSNSKLKKINKR